MNQEYDDYFNFGEDCQMKFPDPPEDFDFSFLLKEKETSHIIFDTPEINSYNSPYTHESHETTSSGCNATTNYKAAPFTIVKNPKQDTTEYNSVSDDAESISDKSKRIKKSRDQAKQRNKSKLEVEKIDKKFIPEGFDDPNLDEHTKKKMIQMIRNRVSAQASRDKKKVYLQQLEHDNNRLYKENNLLSNKNAELNNRLKSLEISYAQIAQENQELKKMFSHLTCHNCGTAQIITPNVEYPSTDERDETLSQSSVTSITRVSRFGFRSGFFNVAMTFATILSLVLMVFMGNGIGGNFDQRDQRITPMRYLAQKTPTYFVSNDQMIPENNLPEKVEYNEIPQISDIRPQETIFMENIKTLKREFQEHHESVYLANKQTLIVDPKDNVTNSQSFKTKTKNAIVDYQFYQPKKFLGKAHQVNQNNTLAREPRVTTIFSPSSFEFKDQEEKQRDLDIYGAPTSQIMDSQYIQFLMPKNSLHLAYLNENHSEFHSPVVSEADDGTMYEVWCKVFYVRELNSF